MLKQKIKILAVDDQVSNLIALEAVFSGSEFQIIEAESGFVALEVLQNDHDIAVVLLDVQMPIMDGYQTASQIKQLPHYSDVPIIFITAVYNEDPHIRRGYEVGGIDYFSKPFDPEILRTKVSIYSANKHKSLLLKEREKQLIETENLLDAGRQLSSILDTLPVGVLMADVNGNICQSNQEISRILGSEKSMANDQYGRILGWWDHEGKMIKTTGGPLEKALHLGISSHHDVIRVNCLDGTEKTLLASASPLMANDGHIVGASVVIQDVTESKKVVNDLEDKIMNLISIGVELNEASR